MKRWMLKFELTHKMFSYASTFPLPNMDCVLCDVSYSGGIVVPIYQPSVVILFFKSKYLPLLCV